MSQKSDEIPGDVADDHRFATQIAALDLTGDGRLEILASVFGQSTGHPDLNAASPSCWSR